MPTYPLAYRIEDFLRRQIDWAELVLAELDARTETTEDGLESLLVKQETRQREAQDFAREYRGLSAEWQGAHDTTEEERSRNRGQSQQAQSLMTTLQSRFDTARQHAHRRATQLRQEANDLRRGSRSVTIYQSETLVAPEFIDKKA